MDSHMHSWRVNPQKLREGVLTLAEAWRSKERQGSEITAPLASRALMKRQPKLPHQLPLALGLGPTHTSDRLGGGPVPANGQPLPRGLLASLCHTLPSHLTGLLLSEPGAWEGFLRQWSWVPKEAQGFIREKGDLRDVKLCLGSLSCPVSFPGTYCPGIEGSQQSPTPRPPRSPFLHFPHLPSLDSWI